MSEVRNRTASFFDLYLAGQVSENGIDDAIDAWHASGDEEARPLSSFLGMAEDEYAVWVMDGRTLPVLREARQTGEELDAAVARYLCRLEAASAAANRAAIHALSHWLRRRSGY